MEEKHSVNVVTNVFLAVLIIMMGAVLWMLYDISAELHTPTFAQATVLAPAPVEQTAAPQKTSGVAVLSPVLYVVARGDTLSCIAPNNWREVARQNGIKNPNLIFPGQKLQIPPETQLHGGCKSKKESAAVQYCRIGADPVDPHRQLSAFEREYRFNDDILVTMGSGSGKTVTCVLKKGETVVIDQNNRVQWVRKCGNPIVNQVIAPTTEPVRLTPEVKETATGTPIKKEKAGLIILKTFEGHSTEPSGGILRDSEGRPVRDSSGNPVTTEQSKEK
jgi:LysM repeat protein